jgi:uncharacterized protein YjbI with pentapeptide repeats
MTYKLQCVSSPRIIILFILYVSISLSVPYIKPYESFASEIIYRSNNNSKLQNTSLRYEQITRDTIDKHELYEIIKQHNIWLLSKGAKGEKADFTNKLLTNIIISNENLENVSFKYSKLNNVTFENTNLSNANFEHSSIADANYKDCILFKVTFDSCIIKYVNFAKVDLESSNFNNAQLNKTNFIDSFLHKATFINSSFGISEDQSESYYKMSKYYNFDFKRHDFSDSLNKFCSIFGSSFRGSTLTDVIFNNANLQFINLSASECSNATFKDTTIISSVMDQTILGESNFMNCTLMIISIKDSYFGNAILKNTKIMASDMYSCSFSDSNLNDVNFLNVNLGDSTFHSSKINNTTFDRVALDGSDLSLADISNSSLKMVKLNNSNFNYVDFTEVIFEPDLGFINSTPSFANTLGLYSLKYQDVPSGLVELRAGLHKQGAYEREREVTFALNYCRNNILHKYNLASAMIDYLLFGWTCQWGLYPFRPFYILLIFIVAFAICYYFDLSRNELCGIWIIYSSNPTIRHIHKAYQSRKLFFKWYDWRRFTFAIYFSILSAFYFGWRDLNVNNWITKLQYTDFSLHSCGSTRFISGMQSLISLYLIVLSFLAYFSRPFD